MNKIKICKTRFKDLFVIKRSFYEDKRGIFSRLFSSELKNYFGLDTSNTQINFSLTKTIGTIRGMHFQNKPFAEKKIVTCISGKVFDVVIDLRKDSKTFLQYYSKNLSSCNLESIIIPKGFAHGFQVLEKNSMLIYFHSMPHKLDYEEGIHPMDSKINIEWPISKYKLSKKDKNFKFLRDFSGILV